MANNENLITFTFKNNLKILIHLRKTDLDFFFFGGGGGGGGEDYFGREKPTLKQNFNRLMKIFAVILVRETAK